MLNFWLLAKDFNEDFFWQKDSFNKNLTEYLDKKIYYKTQIELILNKNDLDSRQKTKGILKKSIGKKKYKKKFKFNRKKLKKNKYNNLYKYKEIIIICFIFGLFLLWGLVSPQINKKRFPIENQINLMSNFNKNGSEEQIRENEKNVRKEGARIVIFNKHIGKIKNDLFSSDRDLNSILIYSTTNFPEMPIYIPFELIPDIAVFLGASAQEEESPPKINQQRIKEFNQLADGKKKQLLEILILILLPPELELIESIYQEYLILFLIKIIKKIEVNCLTEEQIHQILIILSTKLEEFVIDWEYTNSNKKEKKQKKEKKCLKLIFVMCNLLLKKKIEKNHMDLITKLMDNIQSKKKYEQQLVLQIIIYLSNIKPLSLPLNKILAQDLVNIIPSLFLEETFFDYNAPDLYPNKPNFNFFTKEHQKNWIGTHVLNENLGCLLDSQRKILLSTEKTSSINIERIFWQLEKQKMLFSFIQRFPHFLINLLSQISLNKEELIVDPHLLFQLLLKTFFDLRSSYFDKETKFNKQIDQKREEIEKIFIPLIEQFSQDPDKTQQIQQIQEIQGIYLFENIETKLNQKGIHSVSYFLEKEEKLPQSEKKMINQLIQKYRIKILITDKTTIQDVFFALNSNDQLPAEEKKEIKQIENKYKLRSILEQQNAILTPDITLIISNIMKYNLEETLSNKTVQGIFSDLNSSGKLSQKEKNKINTAQERYNFLLLLDRNTTITNNQRDLIRGIIGENYIEIPTDQIEQISNFFCTLKTLSGIKEEDKKAIQIAEAIYNISLKLKNCSSNQIISIKKMIREHRLEEELSDKTIQEIFSRLEQVPDLHSSDQNTIQEAKERQPHPLGNLK